MIEQKVGVSNQPAGANRSAILAKGPGMKEGTRVSWFVEGTRIIGHGVTISDEKNGRILVAVDGGTFAGIPKAYHMVIYCTVTWLTVEL